MLTSHGQLNLNPPSTCSERWKMEDCCWAFPHVSFFSSGFQLHASCERRLRQGGLWWNKTHQLQSEVPQGEIQSTTTRLSQSNIMQMQVSDNSQQNSNPGCDTSDLSTQTCLDLLWSRSFGEYIRWCLCLRLLVTRESRTGADSRPQNDFYTDI